jgi:hypothetical protein
MLLPFYPPSSSFRLPGGISLRNSWANVSKNRYLGSWTHLVCLPAHDPSLSKSVSPEIEHTTGPNAVELGPDVLDSNRPPPRRVLLHHSIW